jgi:predicted ArsR family transcriptional regulator
MLTKRRNMTKQAKGTKFFKEGTQNQQILENYWGNGKSFTTEDLTDNLDIMSPGARLTELRDAGFDVRVVETNSNDSVGRPEATYKIMQRRAFA